MIELDKDAVEIAKNVFLVRAASDPVSDIIVPLQTAIRAYLAALPRASGVPEAEAVAWRYDWFGDGRWIVTDDKAEAELAKIKNRTVEPLYAAPPPVAAPSGEAAPSVVEYNKYWKSWCLRNSPVDALSAELNEAEQRDVLYNAARYSEDDNKFYPGATTKAMHAMGYKIVPIAAPSGEAKSEGMTRERQFDAIWDACLAYGLDVSRDDVATMVKDTNEAGFRIVHTAPPVESQEMTREEIVSRYTMELIAMGCPEEEANTIKRRVEHVLDGIVRGAPKSGEK